MPVALTRSERFARLRSLPAAGPVLAALDGERSVHVVGGAVRDLLLGRAPAELDLVVEGDAVAVARRAAARLGGRVTVHERFGTATVSAEGVKFDLASARRETYARPGALPDVVLGASLADDLARRDVTVNALALQLDDAELTAFPGALEDLRDGVLRVLHDASLTDDPTRLLRLARYAARLGFVAEPHTAALAAAAVAGGAVATVSGERLGAELRLLAREPQPAALLELERFGLARAVVHPALRVDAAWLERALALRPADARPDLVGLAVALAPVPVGELGAVLERLAFPAPDRAVLALAPEVARLLAALDHAQAPSQVRRVLLRTPVELVVLAAADTAPASDRACRWLREWRHQRIQISGHDLIAAGLSGPAVGTGLDAATAALLDGRAPTREAQLGAALASPASGQTG